MAKYLFPNFMESSEEYSALRDFWRSHVWNAALEFSNADWSTPWLAELDRTLEAGNPIFSAWTRDRSRGLKVVQLPPEEGGDELSRWVEWFGGDAHDPAALRTLVIVCVLTDSNVMRIRKWIEEWVEVGECIEFEQTLEITTSADYSPELISAGPH